MSYNIFLQAGVGFGGRAGDGAGTDYGRKQSHGARHVGERKESVWKERTTVTGGGMFEESLLLAIESSIVKMPVPPIEQY